MKNLVSRFVKDESGATAIEYGLIAAGISVAIIAVVQGLGTKLKSDLHVGSERAQLIAFYISAEGSGVSGAFSFLRTAIRSAADAHSTVDFSDNCSKIERVHLRSRFRLDP